MTVTRCLLDIMANTIERTIESVRFVISRFIHSLIFRKRLRVALDKKYRQNLQKSIKVRSEDRDACACNVAQNYDCGTVNKYECHTVHNGISPMHIFFFVNYAN